MVWIYLSETTTNKHKYCVYADDPVLIATRMESFKLKIAITKGDYGSKRSEGDCEKKN
jgi:hypothetical protein